MNRTFGGVAVFALSTLLGATIAPAQTPSPVRARMRLERRSVSAASSALDSE